MDTEAYDAEMKKIVDKANEEPPTRDIFQNKHAARSLMTDLRTRVVDLSKEMPDSVTALHQAADIHVVIAGNLFEVESFEDGYEYLEKAENMLQTLRNKSLPYNWNEGYKKGTLLTLRTSFGDDVDRTFAHTLLTAFNMAGFHWCARGGQDKALQCLHHSMKIYEDFDKWAKKEGDTGHEGLKVSDDGRTTEGGSLSQMRGEVEKVYTSTLFYLAQVYGNDSNSSEAQKYCHLTLQRQLASKKEFDRLEWAINALGLTSFYLCANDYGAARHCIQAAESVMGPLAEDPALKDDEKTQQTIANIHQAYAKWALYLVRYYRDEYTGNKDDDEPEPPKSIPFEWWVDFTCDIEKPAQPEPIPRGAKGWPIVLSLFREAHARYKKALEWYCFDGFVTDYIAIMQDISHFLKAIMVWGEEPEDYYGHGTDRRVAVLKERAKLLEPLPGQLNAKHYLNLQRQVWFELGEIFLEASDLRIAQRNHRREIADKSLPLSKAAVNKVMVKAATYFEKFYTTFEDDGSTIAPPELDPDLCHAYISAKMHGIRLRSKLYASNPKQEYDQLNVACTEYNQLVAWAQAHPQFASRLSQEETTKLQIELASEMVQLLPSKMRDLQKVYMSSA
ncbi:Protein KBP-like protein [Diplonema papillatum]|nr:Protein KBP-like protein [Diplonema papillatum]KAJ9449871.1 Protein KBP-like protein [Diplonema papillatum]